MSKIIINESYIFPKYAKLYGFESCIMIRKSLSKDGQTAYYYRPCGEWGCTIKLKNYEYTSDDPCNKDRSFNIIACSPEEFIEDNPYCVCKDTKELFIEAIKEIERYNYTYLKSSVIWMTNPTRYVPQVLYKTDTLLEKIKHVYKQWTM